MVKLGNAKKTAMAIPETWEIKKLKDVAPLQRGFDLPYSQMKSGVYPVVFSNGIGAYHSEYMIPGPGVITGRSGTIGKVHFVEQHYWPHNTSLWVTDFHGNYEKYVYYLFNRINWNAFNSGSGVPTLNRNDVHEIEVALPPLTEQISIATALSDIDALIANLEKLIAKKKAIKQGAMQELLTGKRRLPGFDGEWKTETWGDVLSCFSSGATPYRGVSSYFKGQIKWVSSGELNYNVIYDTLEHISSEAMEKASLTMHPAGTFLMAITGLEAAGTRGSCALLGVPATTNQSCMAIYSTNKMDTSFLFHYYTFFGNELALKYCQGTKQQSYTAALVKILPITYPVDVDEQIAITAVLDDMNSEITVLEEKLHKAKLMKSGMMSELLTGRIRLIDEEDA